MKRRTQVRIDTAALRHNINLLKSWNGDDFFCPMLKANAYGHGDELVARVCEEVGVSAVGVATIEEGEQLRAAGIQVPILAFAPLSPESAQAAIKSLITLAIGRFEDIAAIERVHQGKPISVHLKFNSGMQRLGFDVVQLKQLKSELSAKSWLQVEGVCTHLTHGEEAAVANGPTQTQLLQFAKMTEGFPGIRHVHKSASLAVLQNRKVPGTGSRPGIGIYGLPHDGRAVGEGLRPVLTWMSELVNIRTVEKGETVSYSGRWTAHRRSVIGVLPIGYGDGYMRSLSNKGAVLCRGQRVPVVGSVCMDYIMVDLTDIAGEGSLQPGESVVVLGRQGNQEVSAADIAEWADTIAYEVVTNISRRVAREAV